MNKINLKGIPTAAWVRIITLLIVLVNQISVSVFEFQLVPYGDEEIYEGVSTVLTVIVSIVTTWKDTPVTAAAQEGNKITKELKGEK